jgi:hypothetical protein
MFVCWNHNGKGAKYVKQEHGSFAKYMGCVYISVLYKYGGGAFSSV